MARRSDGTYALTQVTEALREGVVHAPELIDLETTSVVRTLERSGEISATAARSAVDALRDFPMVRVAHAALLPRCWELRHHVTPYVASYVAVAELFEVDLITTDARLAQAPGLRCSVAVVSQE